MIRLLVAFSTTEGQTERIAHHAASQAEARDFFVRLFDVGHHVPGEEIGDFDGAIVAGALHRGKHQPELSSFINQYRGKLEVVPSAFLSVSLTAASKAEADRIEAQRYADEFLGETGWHPMAVHLVAGAFHHRTTGLLESIALRSILREKGVETDSHRDLELTDWNDFDGFLDGFYRQVEAARPKTED